MLLKMGLAMTTRRDSVTVGAMIKPTPEPLRAEVLGVELSVIDRHVVELFALVSEAAAGATHALVTGDREAARNLVKRDEVIDVLYREVEHLVETELVETEPSTSRSARCVRSPSRCRPDHAASSSGWARSPPRCG
jgi:hypothetical protein